MEKLTLVKTGVIALSLFLAACGGGSSNSSSNTASNLLPTSAAVSFSLLAGSAGGSGNVDGTGAAARFTNPSGTAVDSHGNVYVADMGNSTIRKITPSGVVTTLAGTAGVSGNLDGTGTAAQFILPQWLAVDSQDNVYVIDNRNTIRKITQEGVVTTLAGTAGVRGNVDGTGAAAKFSELSNIAVDSSNTIYVTDANNNNIRKITQAGVVTTFATSMAIFSPDTIAIDSAGNLYVGANWVIDKITPTGTVSTFLTYYPGSLNSNTIGTVNGIAVDNTGNVYLSNYGSSGLEQSILKVNQAGVLTTLAGAGSGSTDGTGTAALFGSLSGLSLDSSGNIYIADLGNNTIRKVSPEGVVTTMAGAVSLTGSIDATGAAARFSNPVGIVADSAGNVYVADSANGEIRKITSSGVVSTFVGNMNHAGSIDGIGTAASFSLLGGLAIDKSGNLYALDGNGSIRKITPNAVVTTLAGSNIIGYADGTGTAAHFRYPQGLAVDDRGNIYVADSGNQVIRKITPVGVVTTLAGTVGGVGSVDGIGSAAVFSNPTGITVDSSGNVYVSDMGVIPLGIPILISYPLNSANAIRKITPAGVVTTIAGTAGTDGNVDGVGTAALFRGPKGLAADANGNVYVADSGNGSIRKIAPTGVVTTVIHGAETSNLALLPNGNLVFDSANAIFTTVGL